jgi:DNA polymerase
VGGNVERTLITLDFETYYSKKEKYFLKNKNSGLTIEQYIRNPKFEPIGLSVKVGNRPAEWLCPHEIEDWVKHVEVAYGWDNVRAIAHNGRFDMAILGWVYNVYPGQIADTMLMSRALQLWDSHSLDNVTQHLKDRYGWGIVRDADGNTTWGKLSAEDLLVSLSKGTEVVDADGKHLMDFTDEEYDRYATYGKTDVDLTWSEYNWFMKFAAFPELEIDVMTATIETFTYPVVELHLPVLNEVKRVVNGKRDALLAKVGATLTDLRSDDKFAELLRGLGVEPPTKVNAKGRTKYAFAKKDLDFLRLLEHEDPNVVELVEARLGNKSSQAVTRVERFIDLASRGPMPMPLEYYAAHTGRWGGADAVNVQNMNRNQLVDQSTPAGTKVFYKDTADAVVAVLPDNKVHLARAGVVENDEEELHIMGLRDAIKAPKGKKLVVLDWSQIELRYNSWIWGEDWILDTLVSGKDVYKVTAAMTYGIEYGEVNKSQRFVGKSQQLGLGYGAGKNGLIVVMGKRSEEFTEQQLQSFVNSYRQSAPNIKRGWDKCKTMLNAMVQGINIELGDKHGLYYSLGNKIMRPNGMGLTYREVHHRPGEMGNELWFWGKNKQTKKHDWEKTFGGKITENLCQASCRDIAAEKVVNLRYKFFEKGWTRDDAHIVMTVHDEIIVCCKDELAEEVFDVMQDVMTKSTGWYASLPLAVDGSIAQRYGCAK